MQRAKLVWRWLAANVVPLALIPLAGAFLWVAIWRVWLPPAKGGAVARTVTTVDAGDPGRKVTTIVRTSRGAGPSRRSETLAMALLFLGVGTAFAAVFHDRIGSIDLGKDGVKIELTPEERDGAAKLAARLAGRGASKAAYGRAFDRYLSAVSSRRPEAVVGTAKAPVSARRVTRTGLSAGEATLLAERIADELP